ncbi:hypothetical protein B0J11DRAFT_588812 [Dendryphion nanum]|uniref:Uncharacterized protein n=1 Tax=Dendryphion nanum TaxID=256645 RepID=A0A9P9EJ26_9PLEO|nr:hypothetical protein B0J11DRAFT_588812 [Dendryphion nanum]
MHFPTLLSVLALTTAISAAPIADSIPSQSLNPAFVARANSKLNQYPKDDCKDNNGSNAPTFHASPPLRKCYDLHSTTVSFYFGLGPLSQTWVYSEAGCKGLSVNIGGKGGCQKVGANFSDGFKTIRSVMMD